MNRPVVIERDTTKYWLLVALVGVVYVLFAFWGSSLGAFPQGQLTRFMIYAIAIAGLNIATGYVGLLSVGHSAFLGLGAFTTGILVVHAHWSPWTTLPVSFAVFMVGGLIVGLPALRIRGLYLAVVTLAFAVSFPELVSRFGSLTGGSGGMHIPRVSMRPPAWSGFTLGEKDHWLYWLCVVGTALTLYVTWSLSRSRYGLAMGAVRENEIAAAAYGVNIASVKVLMFGLSGGITGLAGGLFAMYIGSLFAEGSFTLLSGITLLIGLVIGGERTIFGPLIGGLCVVYVPYYTSAVGKGQGSAVIFAVVLLIVIFLAPSGVAGGLSNLIRKVLVVRAARPTPVVRNESDAASQDAEKSSVLTSWTNKTERQEQK